MTKADIMKLVYSEKELRHVDAAIPQIVWDMIDTSIHVMDYNQGHGVLVNLETKAAEQGINLMDMEYNTEKATIELLKKQLKRLQIYFQSIGSEQSYWDIIESTKEEFFNRKQH